MHTLITTETYLQFQFMIFLFQGLYLVIPLWRVPEGFIKEGDIDNGWTNGICSNPRSRIGPGKQGTNLKAAAHPSLHILSPKKYKITFYHHSSMEDILLQDKIKQHSSGFHSSYLLETPFFMVFLSDILLALYEPP